MRTVIALGLALFVAGCGGADPGAGGAGLAGSARASELGAGDDAGGDDAGDAEVLDAGHADARAIATPDASGVDAGATPLQRSGAGPVSDDCYPTSGACQLADATHYGLTVDATRYVCSGGASAHPDLPDRELASPYGPKGEPACGATPDGAACCDLQGQTAPNGGVIAAPACTRASSLDTACVAATDAGAGSSLAYACPGEHTFFSSSLGLPCTRLGAPVLPAAADADVVYCCPFILGIGVVPN